VRTAGLLAKRNDLTVLTARIAVASFAVLPPIVSLSVAPPPIVS
jgi:hypothetical protein